MLASNVCRLKSFVDTLTRPRPNIQPVMYVTSAIDDGENTARLCLADRFRFDH